MSVFNSKTNTDPGPFDAVAAPEGPAGTSPAAPSTASGGTAAQPSPEPLASQPDSPAALPKARPASERNPLDEPATDDEEELDRLYRFREIAVTAEMRQELLGAKLPLASLDQLADTQPPSRGALNTPAQPPAAPINRNAPTEPTLDRPAGSTPPGVERAPARALDVVEPSYSTTAPTMLSVRRRRDRNRRLVGALIAALGVAILAGVIVKLVTGPNPLRETATNDRAASQPHIAGNRPATPALPLSARTNPTDDTAPEVVVEVPSEEESEEKIEQPSVEPPDKTVNTPPTARSEASPMVSPVPYSSAVSATKPGRSSRAAAARSTPVKASAGSASPARAPSSPPTPPPAGASRRKGFDPEELIF